MEPNQRQQVSPSENVNATKNTSKSTADQRGVFFYGGLSESEVNQTPPHGLRDPFQRPAKRTSASPRNHEISRHTKEIQQEKLVRQRKAIPRRGWRRNLYRATFGFINVGPSAHELREREIAKKVRTPLKGTRRIAIISRKGGVGKTTSTVMLGHVFAAWRGDRIVAIDGNPDAGTLAYRVRRETQKTMSDLISDRDQINRYSDIRAYTSQAPTRLEVVSSDDDPRIATAMGESEYHQAIDLLEHHYNIMLMDTGTGILDSATRGILDLADQLVVVMAPSVDSARALSLTLDWLDNHGYDNLVRGAVAVVNGVRSDSLVELKQMELHFENRVGDIVRVPWDASLEAGAETAIDELRPATRSAYLELAGAVASRFVEEPVARDRVAKQADNNADDSHPVIEESAGSLDAPGEIEPIIDLTAQAARITDEAGDHAGGENSSQVMAGVE